MDMLVDVRAVPGLGTFQMHLLDQAAGAKVLQAIIDGRQADSWRAALHAIIHVVGGGVIR